MTDLLTELTEVSRQVLEQNQRLIEVLQILAEAEAARVQLEVKAQEGDRWVDAATVAQQLGPAFSREKILSDLRGGLFKFGRDYIHTGKQRDPWAFKKSRLEAVYLLAPEKRRVWPVEVA